MIPHDAVVSIRRVPLSQILVVESKPRYLSMVNEYVRYLLENPHNDLGFIRLYTSKAYQNLFELDDGHHKFCAYIIAGRSDALCVVIMLAEKGEENSG